MIAPVVAIIQARMGSTRLPGKTLAPIMGKPLLGLMLERVGQARTLDALVVATTINGGDDVIESVASSAGADVVRGSETDVLSRYHEAARQSRAGTVVRLTADCPLLAPEVVDRVVSAFTQGYPSIDLVTNTPPTGRTYPDGMDVEVFSRTALDQLHREADQPDAREHVTPGFFNGEYRIHEVHLPSRRGHVRLTVDVSEDLERVRSIFETLYPANPTFSLADVLQLLEDESARIGA